VGKAGGKGLKAIGYGLLAMGLLLEPMTFRLSIAETSGFANCE
jgi:hypothetical protein